MEFDKVIKGRRSTRGFKSKPVTREVLEEVLELAVRSPSSMNTQPWHFHIVTGEVLDNIRRENTERNLKGQFLKDSFLYFPFILLQEKCWTI